jgi:hypothetical protein
MAQEQKDNRDHDAAQKLLDAIQEYPASGEADDNDPTRGYEVITQRGKRHYAGGTERFWIKIGINDPWADNTQYPIDWFCKEYKLAPSQCLRITAYDNFPQRDSDDSTIEYDLIIMQTARGPVAQNYGSHDVLRENNAAVKKAMSQEEGR